MAVLGVKARAVAPCAWCRGAIIAPMTSNAHDPKNESTTADAPPIATDGSEHLAPMDFSTFLMSLASSAMVTLGKLPAPGSDAAQTDLTAAQQIIDILGILETKTKGNLDSSETKLLQSLLYDLRVQYVDAKKQK